MEILNQLRATLLLYRRGAARQNHSRAAGQFSDALLKLVALDIFRSSLILSHHLFPARADLSGLSAARGYQCLGGGDPHLARRTEVRQFRILDSSPEIDRNDFPARGDSDVLQHGLAPMAIFRGVDRRYLEVGLFASRQQLHDDGRRNLLRNNQQRPTALFDHREDAVQLIHRHDLVVRHQDERIIEDDLHPLDIGHHVMREIAPLERHPFDDFQGRLDGRSKLHRYDAVIAGALERLRDHLAQRRVVGRDAGYRAKPAHAVHRGRRGLQQLDGLRNRDLQTLHQLDGVGASGEQLEAVLDKHVREHRRRRRAIAGDLVGLLGNLTQHLRTHVLERILQLDFARDVDAVPGDDWCADRAIDDRIHAFGPESAAHRLREFGDAAAERLAGRLIVQHDLRHGKLSLASIEIRGSTDNSGRSQFFDGTRACFQRRIQIEARRKEPSTQSAVEFGVDADATDRREIAREGFTVQFRPLGGHEGPRVGSERTDHATPVEITPNQFRALRVERQGLEFPDRHCDQRLAQMAGGAEMAEQRRLAALERLHEKRPADLFDAAIGLLAESDLRANVSCRLETFNVEADLDEVEGNVLGEAQFVGRIRENGGVDHLGIAIALRLHHRCAQAKLGVLPSAQTILQDLDPGFVHALWRVDRSPLTYAHFR